LNGKTIATGQVAGVQLHLIFNQRSVTKAQFSKQLKRRNNKYSK